MSDAGPDIVTPHQLVRDGAKRDGAIVVLDKHGGVVGAGMMEAAATHGGHVFIVTPHFAVAEDIDLMQRVPLYERLLSAGAEFIPNHDVERVESDRVILRNIYSHAIREIAGVGTLAVWTGSTAHTELNAMIEATGLSLHVVGDCNAPRTAGMAFAEGAMAARAI